MLYKFFIRNFSRVSSIRVFVLMLFSVSLYFENWKVFGFDYFTVSRLFAFIYIFLSFFDFKNLYYVGYRNGFFLFISLMLLSWITIASFVHYFFGDMSFRFDFTLFQQIVFFWLLSNEVRIDESIIKKIIFSLCIGSYIVAVFLMMGVGVQTQAGESTFLSEGTRLYFFGRNPNDLASLLAAVLVSVVWLFHEHSMPKIEKYILFLSVPIILILIGYTGSRGGLLTVSIGLMVLFLFKKLSIVTTTKNLFIISLFVVVACFLLSDFNLLVERVQSTFITGDTGDRFPRWLLVWDYIANNPLFGVTSLYEPLDGVSSYYVNPHNAFLQYGYVAGLPAMLLLTALFVLSFRVAINNRRKYGTAYYLSIVLVCLITASKSGLGMNLKFIWLFLAFLTVPYNMIMSVNNNEEK